MASKCQLSWPSPHVSQRRSRLKNKHVLYVVFCLTCVFVCFPQHTVTPWPCSETRHRLDLDTSLKAHANSHKGNTEACSCLDLTAGLGVDTDRAFVCLVSSPAAISHRTPLLTFYACAQQELRFVISYSCGWRSLCNALHTLLQGWQHSALQRWHERRHFWEVRSDVKIGSWRRASGVIAVV